MRVVSRLLLVVAFLAVGPAWAFGCQNDERGANVGAPSKTDQVEVERENGQIRVEREGPVERGLEKAGKATDKALRKAGEATGKGLEKAGEGIERAGEWMQDKAD